MNDLRHKLAKTENELQDLKDERNKLDNKIFELNNLLESKTLETEKLHRTVSQMTANSKPMKTVTNIQTQANKLPILDEKQT